VLADTRQTEQPRISHYVPNIASLLFIAALLGVIVVSWGNPSARGYYNMRHAETLLKEGRYSAAQALLEQTLPIYNSPQVRLDLSYAYLARRDAVRAERQARIVLDEAPPQLQPSAWAQLGRVLAFSGHDSGAVDAWNKAIQLAPSYVDNESAAAASRSARWHIAMLDWSQGDWAAVQAQLTALASGSDFYAQSAKIKLAQLLAPTQPDLLLPSITQTASQGPATPDLRVPGLTEGLSLSTMSQALDDMHRARAAAEAAVEAGEDAAAIDTIWGGSYLQQGENLLALDYLQRAAAANPRYEPAQARLALALLNLGRSAEASQHIDTAVSLDASDPLPHHVLANLYLQDQQWDQAKQQLTLLSKLEPTGVETYLQWAEYYRLLGDYDNAENRYVDAANLQVSGAAAPSGTNAPLTLAHFYTDVRGFGCEKGLPAARQSLALHPDDPASFDAIGWSLMLCKQPLDALSGLEGAVKAAPDVPRYRLHLAKVYNALGRYADAREQYEWVLDLDPGGPLERLALDDLVALPR
jgi:tetratricopeptide (TPR) repeat protein